MPRLRKAGKCRAPGLAQLNFLVIQAQRGICFYSIRLDTPDSSRAEAGTELRALSKVTQGDSRQARSPGIAPGAWAWAKSEEIKGPPYYCSRGRRVALDIGSNV